MVTGGVARPQSYELIGPLASGVLEQVTLDVAFLGVDALDVELGASAHHEGEASVNHLLISRASQVVVVADSSKIGKRAFSRICPTDRIDTLVTDAQLSDCPRRRADRRGRQGHPRLTLPPRAFPSSSEPPSQRVGPLFRGP